MVKSISKSASISKARPQTREAGIGAYGFNGHGLTPDLIPFRQTYWGQPQPVNYELLWRMYREDPVISGVVNIQVNDIIGDGWDLLEGDAVDHSGQDVAGESARESARHIREVFYRSNFGAAIRDIITQYLVYGDAYFELIRAGEPGADRFNPGLVPGAGSTPTKGKGLSFDITYDAKGQIVQDAVSESLFKEVAELKVSEAKTKDEFISALRKFEKRLEDVAMPQGKVIGFVPRDAKTFRIDYDEHGNVVKYIQRVLHRRVDFYPQEVVHLAASTVGNRPYGMSSLGALLDTFMAKQSAENYSTGYFKRGAIPRLIYVAKNFSKEQTDRLVANLKSLQPQQDIVIFGDVDPKMVAPTNQDMQFSDLLGYLKQNIYIATQVPPILAGDTAMGAQAGRNTSQVQLDMYYKRIKSLKKDIEDAINRKLLSPENFGTHNLRFKFLEDNTKEELRRAQQAQLYSSIPWATPNIVLEALHLPPLEGEWSKYGNTPIYFIQQEQQEKMMAQQAQLKPAGANAGGKPNSGSLNKPGQANPARSVTHSENAEENNAAQQSDSKKSFSPFDRDQIAGVANQKYDIALHTRLGDDNAGPMMPSVPEAAMAGFGAHPEQLPDPEDARRYLELRDAQVTEAVENPVQNAFSLNTDRQWNNGFALGDVMTPVASQDDAKVKLEAKPVAGATINQRNPVLQGPLRLAADDLNIETKPVSTATFYKGMTQLEELGLEKPKAKKKV